MGTKFDEINRSVATAVHCVSSWTPEPAYTPSSTEAELKRLSTLERECVKGLRRIRAALSFRRNMNVKVNKLPVEILRMIFTFCGLMPEPDIDPIEHPDHAIASTCAHWRTIALAHPAMWCNIDLLWLSSGRVKQAFLLSRNHPLRIRYDAQDGFNFNKLTKLVSKELYRIQELDMNVDISSRALLPFLPTSPTDQPLPLEHLSMKASRGELSSANLSFTVLDDPLFAGLARNLRSLLLYGVRMPWNHGFYRQLSTLRIEHCPIRVHSRQDFDICSIIRDSPNLQSLHISLYDPVKGQVGVTEDVLAAPWPSTSPCTVMKSLRTLILDLPVPYIHRILSSIDADAIETFRLSLFPVYVHDAHLIPSLLQSGVIPHSDMLTNLNLLALCLRKEYDTKTSLSAWRDGTATDSPCFSIEWFDKMSDSTCRTTLRQLVRNIKQLLPTPIEHLRLETCATYHGYSYGDHPFNILLDSPRLTSLEFDEASAALVLPLMTYGPLPTAAAGWPRLAEIKLLPENVLSEAVRASLAVFLLKRTPQVRRLCLKGVTIDISSEQSVRGLIQSIQGLAADVQWDDCAFQRGWCLYSLAQLQPMDLQH